VHQFLTSAQQLIDSPQPQSTAAPRKRSTQTTADTKFAEKLADLKGRLSEWGETEWSVYQFIRLLIGTAQQEIKTGDMPVSGHLAQPDARARYQLREHASSVSGGHPVLCQVGFRSDGSLLFNIDYPDVATVTERLKSLRAQRKASAQKAAEEVVPTGGPDEGDEGGEGDPAERDHHDHDDDDDDGLEAEDDLEGNGDDGDDGDEGDEGDRL
jgi:hypothetical protein